MISEETLDFDDSNTVTTEPRVEQQKTIGHFALIERLGSKETFVRVEMANALATLGAKGKDALPALEKLKDDPDPGVREAAADAIKAIGGE